MISKQDYIQYGRFLCECRIRTQLGVSYCNEQPVYMTDKEINHVISNFKFDYDKLMDHELNISLFNDRKHLASSSIHDFCTYSDSGTDKNDIISHLDLNGFGETIIKNNKSEYIVLPTGKVVWYALSKSRPGLYDDFIAEIKRYHGQNGEPNA